MLIFDLLFKLFFVVVILFCLYKGGALVFSKQKMSGPDSIGKSLSFLVFIYPSVFTVLLAITTFTQGPELQSQTIYQYLLLSLVFILAGHISARNSENVILINAVFLICLGFLPVLVISFIMSTMTESPDLMFYLISAYIPSILLGAFIKYKSLDSGISNEI